MKLYFLTIGLIFFTVTGFSQSKEKIYLWPAQVPGETAEKREPVKRADTGDNVTRLTDVTNPVMEVYKPENRMNNGAGVIICPGGGYNILAIDKEGYEVAEWLNKLGYTAFVLQYRVPDKYEGALNDIQRAIRLVRSKANLYKVNPDKIGVMGFSAGASLSARASTNYLNETYSKVDEADELSCNPDFALLIYAGGLDKGENKSLSTDIIIQEETPPMFIFGTADDKHGNSSLVMAGAMRDAGIPAELHLLPKGGHGYGLREGNVAAETWPVLAEGWLMKNVLNEKASFQVSEVIPRDAPEKLVHLMNKLAEKETNPLMKEHFQSVALFATDTTHGFQVTEENMKEASRVIQFFENEGAEWETYIKGPRPLIMSFKSPTDGKYSFYKLFIPKNFNVKKTDYPLYLELHGSGGGSNNNPRRMLFMSLQPQIKGVTSQGYRKEGFLVYPWGRGDKMYRGISETDIFEALTHFDEMFETDPKRQYIYGFSMGGGGTFKIAQQTIDRWTAAGIYSGAIFNPVPEEARKFADVPVWMAWGELEDRLGKGNRELKDLFLNEGIEVNWKEIKGVKHSYLGEYQEDLMDWFETKVK